jgi:hypothetical protein
VVLAVESVEVVAIEVAIVAIEVAIELVAE